MQICPQWVENGHNAVPPSAVSQASASEHRSSLGRSVARPPCFEALELAGDSEGPGWFLPPPWEKPTPPAVGFLV